MAADDATMYVIIWNHLFPSKKPLLEDYPTHEHVNSHIDSVRVYPLKFLLSTVRTQTLVKDYFMKWISVKNMIVKISVEKPGSMKFVIF